MWAIPTGPDSAGCARPGHRGATRGRGPDRKPHPETPRPVQARTEPFPARAPSTRPNPAPPAETEAVGAPVTHERGRTRPPAPPVFGTPTPDRAAQLWADSRAVTLDPAHPARLWAARRHLWRPGDPWPEALRWIQWSDGGGSLVAAFAPVPDWRTAHPPTPPAVQLVHVGPDEGERPETAERVEWADTRNLASRPERAAAQMAATAKAAPELKRLAGGSAAGRKLEKPVLHYTLSWGKDERPDRAEMNRAAEETLKALGLERHQALIVAHRDKDHPHLHVIANRIDPQTGKAAKLGNDRLKLANWAERWERNRGGLRCPERVTNRRKREANKKRSVRKYVKDWKSLHTARHRRERMHPPQVQRRIAPRVLLKTPAHRQKWADQERAAWTQQQADRPRERQEVANIYRHQWRQHFAAERSDQAEVKTLASGGVAGSSSACPDRRGGRLGPTSPGHGREAGGWLRPEDAPRVEGGPVDGRPERDRSRPDRSGRGREGGAGEAGAGAPP